MGVIEDLQFAARRAVLLALRAYKWLLSPLLPAACRYTPTCSEFAREAVDRHGILRGAWMVAARLLRCHPFAGSGYDPVSTATGSAPATDDRRLTTEA